MSGLRIEIVKRADGAGVLRCRRADGSVSWQKQAKYAAYFALHDLTHFAVEAVLGCRRASFGLIAEGWDIEDTTGKDARWPLPEETIPSGANRRSIRWERASRVQSNADEFSANTGRTMTDDELRRIRELRAELFVKWAAVAPSTALELEFAPKVYQGDRAKRSAARSSS